MAVWMPGDSRPKCETEGCKSISRREGPECRRCYMRRHQAERRRAQGFTHRRDESLRTKYGITYWDYERMLKDQSGRCAICLTDAPGHWGVFHVDHCHTTGQVRGLLCHLCNMGLGSFQDDGSRLDAARDYISYHRMRLSTNR